MKAEKDGTASVVVKIDDDGKVTEIIAAKAEPAGLQLERAAAVSVAATKFQSGQSGRYRAKVIFSYAALETAYRAGRPFTIPGMFMPEPDPEDFPTRAGSGGTQGVVDFDLEVGPDGLLTRIGILRETPKGLGLALVALYYGNKIIFHPATEPGRYTFSLNFVQRFK